MFASEHRAKQIDIENTFKGIGRYVFEGRIAFDADPNIVMQDIDRLQVIATRLMASSIAASSVTSATSAIKVPPPP